MMKLITIMTMNDKPRTIMTDNVFVENDGICLPPPSASDARLAAVTYIVSVTSKLRQGRLECLDFASRRISESMPGDRLWLLASQGAWQSDTIRMRTLKLWRWLENGGIKTPTTAQGAEIARADSRGIRWFSVAEISEEELSIAHDIVSAEQTSFLIASSEAPTVEDYLAAGWAEGHPGRMSFWRDMALVASDTGCLMFRPFGNFDDFEVGVNVIGSPETVARLGAGGPDLRRHDH